MTIFATILVHTKVIALFFVNFLDEHCILYGHISRIQVLQQLRLNHYRKKVNIKLKGGDEIA